MFVPLRLERKIDHHDAVLLDDADQQDDADQRNDAELGLKEQQREHRTHSRRGQRRENGDGVNDALIENAEHDIDRGERREDEHRLVLQRLLIGARGALEAAMDGRGHADLIRCAFDGRGRSAKGCIGRKIERDRRCDEGALMIDGERRVAGPVFAEHRERHHLLGRCAVGRSG